MDIVSTVKKNPRHYCQLTGYLMQIVYGIFSMIYGAIVSLKTERVKQNEFTETYVDVVSPDAYVGFIMLFLSILLIGFGIASLVGMYNHKAKIYNDKFFITGIDIVVNVAAIVLTTDAIQFIFFPIICLIFLIGSFFFKNEKSINDFYTQQTYYINTSTKTAYQIEEIEQKFKKLKENGVISERQYEDLINRMEEEKKQQLNVNETLVNDVQQ